ncbi:MAG: RNA polymerase subunit sigma-24 [Desulfobacterales bacterium CG23_combo_of_CG06-09_8_20_14_all_51_8]|nr:MAG: RNA polymerase subunit sigma-24 [Desulfobacterales bacterium CG23_combo_of_CG06-09_8_20_14_all_51_8]
MLHAVLRGPGLVESLGGLGPDKMTGERMDADAALMLQFKEGHEEAFLKLFAKYQAPIINFCFRFCSERTLAEDLAQEVFLRVYRGRGRYRVEARFSTWLYRIAVNVCLNETRKLRKNYGTYSLDQPANDDPDSRVPEFPDENQVLVDDAMVSHQRDERIHRALQTLPDPQRIALVLRIYDEFPYDEIASRMNVSEGKVKTLIFRGRRRLREALEGVL